MEYHRCHTGDNKSEKRRRGKPETSGARRRAGKCEGVGDRNQRDGDMPMSASSEGVQRGADAAVSDQTMARRRNGTPARITDGK